MRYVLLCLFYVLAMHGAQAAPAAPAAPVLSIGGKTIHAVVPNGFVPVPSGSELFATLSGLSLPQNRLQAVYLSRDDIGTVEAGKDPALTSYFAIETSRRAEVLHATKSDFKRLQAHLKAQQVTMMKKSVAETQESVDRAVKGLHPGASAQLLDNEILGQFVETDTEIGLLSVVNIKVAIAGESKDTPLLVANTVALVNNRIVSLYAYSQTATPAGIAALKQASLDWIAKIQQANPKSE